MICYKDRAFCSYYPLCADGKDCPRAATPEVREEARSFNMMIDYFGDKPDCFVEPYDDAG